MDELVEVQNGQSLEHMIFVSKELNEKEYRCLVCVFACSIDQISGIDPSVACHKLEVNPKAKLVRQKPRRLDPDRRDRVNEEVDCLLSVGFIKPAKFQGGCQI